MVAVTADFVFTRWDLDNLPYYRIRHIPRKSGHELRPQAGARDWRHGFIYLFLFIYCPLKEGDSEVQFGRLRNRTRRDSHLDRSRYYSVKRIFRSALQKFKNSFFTYTGACNMLWQLFPLTFRFRWRCSGLLPLQLPSARIVLAKSVLFRTPFEGLYTHLQKRQYFLRPDRWHPRTVCMGLGTLFTFRAGASWVPNITTGDITRQVLQTLQQATSHGKF
jgi:hypothetical protein